jgi:hypothetical protein
LRDQLVKRLVRHRLPQTGILLLEILDPLHLFGNGPNSVSQKSSTSR